MSLNPTKILNDKSMPVPVDTCAKCGSSADVSRTFSTIQIKCSECKHSEFYENTERQAVTAHERHTKRVWSDGLARYINVECYGPFQI